MTKKIIAAFFMYLSIICFYQNSFAMEDLSGRLFFGGLIADGSEPFGDRIGRMLEQVGPSERRALIRKKHVEAIDQQIGLLEGRLRKHEDQLQNWLGDSLSDFPDGYIMQRNIMDQITSTKQELQQLHAQRAGL